MSASVARADLMAGQHSTVQPLFAKPWRVGLGASVARSLLTPCATRPTRRNLVKSGGR